MNVNNYANISSMRTNYMICDHARAKEGNLAWSGGMLGRRAPDWRECARGGGGPMV